MKKIILKITLASAVAIAATVGIYAYNIYETTTVAIDKIGTPEVVPVEQSAKVKPLTLLMMGIDYRPESGSLNSDVIMVVTVNPEQHSATLVSLPRDLQMAPKGLPSRKANYYYPYFNNAEKNSAFVETKKVFSDFMGVPIDYMVTIDFDGFRQVVDLMGGLTINVDMDMRYVDDEDGTDINLKKGIAKLSGKQTLDFVRYRKSNRNTDDSSDLARNQRQQQVLNQLMSSLKSTGGVTKLGQIIETVGSHMKTDVPASQIRDLMTTYFDISPSDVNYVHLDGEWESPYIIVKDEELELARAALKKQLGDKGAAVVGEDKAAAGLGTGSGNGKESVPGSGSSSSKGSGTGASGGSSGKGNSSSGAGTGTGNAAGTSTGKGGGSQTKSEDRPNKDGNGAADPGGNSVGEATYGSKDGKEIAPKSPVIIPPIPPKAGSNP
ncbi:LytR family transcriptional regulator [Paenibacillus sp. LMG 31456]|uniref:LytR family transcriptional regulator n=1 Tax=Paenibacillus foliorum TaxID=2654974 RepID=A0A972K267_9BACL|nr:LCP family protein [Paenibacillus foliorum]NOU96441.1 LytR family transcriptional regulator [Paenibacillus foliorum]